MGSCYSGDHIAEDLIHTDVTLRNHNRTGLVVLGRAYCGLTGGFLLLRNFSVAISLSPHVCFIFVLILISMFLR